MKKMKTLTCDVTEEYYRNFPALNYSKIAKFETNGPSSLLSSETKVTDSMKFGSIVDTILTNADQFTKKYYVADVIKPSDAVCNVIDHIFKNAIDFLADDITTYPTLE